MENKIKRLQNHKYLLRGSSPPLVILFMLMLACKLIDITHVPETMSPSDHITNLMTDIVCHHQALTLCSNTRNSASLVNTTGRSPQSMDLKVKHTATINILMLIVCGDVQLNPGPANIADVLPCGFCKLHVG